MATNVSNLTPDKTLTAIGMLREMISMIERGEWRVDTFTMNRSELSDRMTVVIGVAPGRFTPPLPLESPDPLEDVALSEQTERWMKAQAAAIASQAAFRKGQDLRFAQGAVCGPEFGTSAEYDRGEWIVDPDTGETYRLPFDEMMKRKRTSGEVRALNESVKAERKTQKREAEARKPVTPAGASPARDLDL